ncbi:MAG: ATP-grasp domain-containing protein [Deltaproteobacteria bacterium]|nr:ATP-grasp domain-containing protein [Deltaproteobacteria bacterium]
MKRDIHKLLVANRGEIASRIFRTAHAMGIATVATFSDADADLPFVRDAGEAFRLGPGPSRDSYLRIDRILEAAKQTGADAVHPGFGFLAENDAFAQAVIDAGLTWVGPSPAAIRAMGLKREAKNTATKAGVPVIPGYSGEDQSVAAFASAAKNIGYPLLLKASAGGGGKGMRIVRGEDELEAAYESARREAESAFGNPTLIAEKYLERPRHIEIQILGDEHGQVLHFMERECSVQRRHQKILEEAPSVAIDGSLRARIGASAVALCQAIGYTNAGTVELVLTKNASGEAEFFFLEVNTRLQVEHPVTEGILPGLDLVEEQIRIARGERLRWDAARVAATYSGWSIEVRLCAEDPASDFLPQSGPIADFHLPREIATAPWLRIESAVERGSVVSIHYDSMIAKLIVRGGSREEAIQRLRLALSSLSVPGIRTNRRFLLALVDHPAFVRGELDTHFIETHLGDAKTAQASVLEVERAASIGALVLATLRSEERALLPSLPASFRNNRYGADRTTLSLHATTGVDEVEHVVALTPRRDGACDVSCGGTSVTARVAQIVRDASLGGALAGDATIDLGSHRVRARFVIDDDNVHVHVAPTSVSFTRVPRLPRPGGESAADGSVAPMPGKILRVLVAVGDQVETGATLLLMEAMKMEHAIKASHAGKVAEVRVAAGDQVDGGQLLIVLGE